MPCLQSLGCNTPRPNVSEYTLLSDPRYQDYIAHAMLDVEGHQAAFRHELPDLSEPARARQHLVVAKMGLITREQDKRLDTSFTQQMHLAKQSGPDVYVALFRAGIPLLDAVAGYYEETGEPVPTLQYVDPGGRWDI